MYKTMIKTLFVSILSLMIAPAAFALSGGGASSVEPGDACEAAVSGAFSRAQGAPFQGTTTVTWDVNNGGVVAFDGVATQFGTGCEVAFSGKIGDPIFQEQFEALTARDLVGVCITNVQVAQGNSGDCSKKGSDFMESLVSTRLRFTARQPGVQSRFTVEMMLTPLVQDF